jgi:hypothetical protein
VSTLPGPADVKKKIDPLIPSVESDREPLLPVNYDDQPGPGPLLLEPSPVEYRGEAPDDNGFDGGDRQPDARIILDVKKQWPAFLESLMRDRPNIGTFLSLAVIVGSSESSIDLCFPHKMKFQFNEMTKKQTRDEIIAALAAFMDRPIEVRITLSTEPAESPERNYFQPVHQTPILDNEIEREPIIRSVLDIFDGEIIR